MADIKLRTDVGSLDLEAAITQAVNGDSDDFFELAKTLGLNPLTDFEGSDLHGITLEPRSDLRGANLRSANLKEAVLGGVLLTGAHLIGAHLIGAHLNDANLHKANLHKANLTGAHLIGANLTGAHLRSADLTGAYLSDTTGVTAEQIIVAHNWQAARYSPNFRQRLGLPPEAPNS